MTLPSHASILTGNDPPVHGIRDNGAYRLPDAEVTLAEVLEERGYRTAAFIAAFVLDRRFGLSQGFEVYDDQAWSDVSMLENLEAERNADAVYSVFAEWLNDHNRARPFFAWIHLYDPHAPYTPPEPYRDKYRVDAYAGEVAYTDAVVGKIVGELESKKLMEKTLIAVVGDHGEGLGDHDELTHSLLIYNSTLHVPMLIHGPGLVPAGTEVKELTRVIDLAPTLLDYLGLKQGLGRGKSLRPLTEGKALKEEISAYSESLYPSLNFGWSELKGLESGRYRFIAAPTPELYDMDADPTEKNNLMESLPDVGGRLQNELNEIVAEMESEKSHSTQAIDSETEAMLRSLGYVAGSAPEAGSSDVDPKTKMATFNRIQFGIAQFSSKDYRGALETFAKIKETESHIPLVYEYLGSCHMRLEQHQEAERVYREALERGLRSADFHVNLGLIYYYRRQLPPAEKELRAALVLENLNVEAHHRLADVYRTAKNYDSAVEHYQKALDINPSYVFAWNGLGMTLATVGRNEEALSAFREAVRIDPDGAQVYFNLAVLLERMKRDSEALEAYRKFMDLPSGTELVRERERAAAAIQRLESR
jgi:arylsulfatase A-like enzyme/Tfp pilus assembly protein PilF